MCAAGLPGRSYQSGNRWVRPVEEWVRGITNKAARQEPLFSIKKEDGPLMPSAYVHEVIAQDALARLTLPEGWNAACDAALQLGAQGPDLFFYYAVLSPLPPHREIRFGHWLHKHKTGKVLVSLVQEAANRGPVAKAFALGFLAHYAGDTTIHPYVAGWAATGWEHLPLEKVLEAWLYRKRGGQGIPLQLSQFSHLTPDAKEEAAATLSAALRRALPREARWISPKRMMHAISDAGKVTRLVYSPSGSRYEFMRKVENLLHYPMLITNHMIPLTWQGDPDNAGHKPWRNPDAPEEVRTESVEDLVAVATTRTMRYMQAALDYWAGQRQLDEVARLLGNLSYGNGLPCQG
jgi:hypothetical protein